MSQSEALSVLDSVPSSSRRLVMIGVLASQKTVFLGGANKWPNRYPNLGDIAGIFPVHSLALNLVHYNTKEPETLLEQMLVVTRWGGPNFEGFQLNVAWPRPRILEKYRRRHGNMYIVLQIGGGAFKKIGDSPLRLAKKVIGEYKGLVDYVLLDPSGGYGKPFDSERIREYLVALREEGAERFIGLGVAGGLSPTTLNLVEPLVKDFPEVSIDAEGRLRDGNDKLDVSVAKKYVSKALEIFAS
ncbi:MAG: hypothetical protein Q8R36_03570 [bacterium]|nr:hypothetical protein [bacterium]